MSFKHVNEKLLDIKQTASTNDKISLLSKYLQNEEFKRVIQLIYDNTKYYHINKLPKMKSTLGLFDKVSNEELFTFLEKLAEQSGTTNEDKEKLCKLASMDKETYEVVQKIVQKDAGCGIGGKSINKAFPGLIFLMPYMRCSTDKKLENIDFENRAIVQEKADGAFINIIIDGDLIVLRSRSGKKFNQLNHIIDKIKKVTKKYNNTVFMGELLVKKNGRILPRKTGNGILNSCIQNTANIEDTKDVIVKLWDAVPVKDFWRGVSKIDYVSRLTRVTHFIRDLNEIEPSKVFGKIETKQVLSLKDAQEFYRKMRKEGKEGAILKNKYSKWKDHTSTQCIKLKNVMEFDLKIVDWKHGKEGTRFSHCMGAITCESECGELKVSVGTGFTDEDREKNWDEHLGKIVTVSCESIIKGKTDKLHSLYLPRFIEIREDRMEAQTLEDMMSR